MRTVWIGVVVALLASLPATPGHATWTDVCGSLARAAERTEHIPPGLIQALALAESGRWTGAGKPSQAWPWTVTSGSDSFYLSTKDAAVHKVRELQGRGRTNIDVGCMQINLRYHGEAFASLEHALDPAANVAYGARFLKDLRAKTQSWARATAYYHSRNPTRGESYRSKVFRLWNEVRRRRTEERLGPQEVALNAVDDEFDDAAFQEAMLEAAGPLVHRGERRATPLVAGLEKVGQPLRMHRTGLGGNRAAPGAIAIVRGR